MLLANGTSRAVSVGGRKQVLTDEALDVTSVARHLLVTDIVVRSVDPVLRIATSIAEDDLILVNIGHEGGVETTGLISLLEAFEQDRVLARVCEDLTLDLTSSGTEALVLGRHVTSVAWQVLLLILSLSYNFTHFYLIFTKSKFSVLNLANN